jgi:hypothetical protein
MDPVAGGVGEVESGVALYQMEKAGLLREARPFFERCD